MMGLLMSDTSVLVFKRSVDGKILTLPMIYEVDYLPENDRIRYTISPNAKKEVLKRLLKLNHKIHAKGVKSAFDPCSTEIKIFMEV